MAGDLIPRDEADVADAIREAAGPLIIKGGGTRPIGLVDPGVTMSLSKLSGITLYEPGAMTMVAEAGTPIGEIEAVLNVENQRLAFEPMDHRHLLGTKGVPTIGGVYATNTSGPRRIQIGAARDHMLGMRFVDGQGNCVSNGGRVMKNVTGYDLVKMMAGSWGTLGVVTEVSLKVMPKPETEGTLAIKVPDAVVGVQVLSAALGSPFDVTGAAYMDGAAYVRVEGFETSVAYRLAQLTDRLAGFGEVTESADPMLWHTICNVIPFAGQDGDVWKISVKPTDGPRVADALPGRAILDWGGGLVWALVPEGTDVRTALTGIAGHATCVRGVGCGPAFPPVDPAVAALTNGLKAQYDPRNILNPGRMG